LCHLLATVAFQGHKTKEGTLRGQNGAHGRIKESIQPPISDCRENLAQSYSTQKGNESFDVHSNKDGAHPQCPALKSVCHCLQRLLHALSDNKALGDEVRGGRVRRWGFEATPAEEAGCKKIATEQFLRHDYGGQWGRTGKSRSTCQQKARAASPEAGGDTNTAKEDSFAVDACVPRSRRQALP